LVDSLEHPAAGIVATASNGTFRIPDLGHPSQLIHHTSRRVIQRVCDGSQAPEDVVVSPVDFTDVVSKYAFTVIAVTMLTDGVAQRVCHTRDITLWRIFNTPLLSAGSLKTDDVVSLVVNLTPLVPAAELCTHEPIIRVEMVFIPTTVREC